MHGCGVVALLWCAAVAGERTFEVAGQVSPAAHAAITLHGATTPFTASTLTDAHGRFRFTKVAAGQYTVLAFAPGYGETRTSIDVGPSSSDAQGRQVVTVRLDSDGATAAAGATVSVNQLAVPDSARRHYAGALKRLAKRDVEGAVVRLRRAVEIAPNYTAAWNNLGTIAYQTRKYTDAEEDFRHALLADPEAFEPLVNLGGVLLTREKIDEAYRYNLYAVLRRPEDALANSQLGMNYFALGKLELAEKYLKEARRLDPAHFSHPQLLLAEIALRRHDRAGAVGHLEDFLQHHPDWPEAARIREMMARLRRR